MIGFFLFILSAATANGLAQEKEEKTHAGLLWSDGVDVL
jgi:hypothetical protein